LRSLGFVLASTLIFAFGLSVRGEQPFYLGAWKLAAAVPAPWATSPPQQSDAAEAKALTGKTVRLTPAAIAGPKVFACKRPHYKIGAFTADMLFQGAFGEMHDADKSKDPLKLAAALGFTGTSFKTLETGCEIDWHFINDATAAIGLDNYIYTLKKAVAGR
jgi:hypothetical protein